MKKCAISLIGVIVFLMCHGTAQGSFWSVAIDDAYIHSVQQTADGGYIAAGGIGGCGDALVLKLNADGSAAWQKTYNGFGFSTCYYDFKSIQQTADGGFALAGGFQRAWMLKLNADGSVAWQKTYSGSGSPSHVWSMKQTTDGGFILAGNVFHSSGIIGDILFPEGNNDVWVMKLNADGSVAWQKTYDGSDGDSAPSIQQTADGGYLVAGYTESSPERYDAWLLKLNADGSVAWQKSYGGFNNDTAFAAQQTADGGFIVAGSTQPRPNDHDNAWVLKLNADGTVAWQKSYGGLNGDRATSIQQTADGGYVVLGNTDSFGAGRGDAWVLKLNADGSVAWQKTYGSINWDRATSIQQTAEGGYIVTVSTHSTDNLPAEGWVLKLDQNGGIGSCSAVTISDSPAVVSDTFAVSADSTATVASGSMTFVEGEIVASVSSHAAAVSCSHTSVSTACSATLSSDFRLHIPVVDFQGTACWADFRRVPDTLDFVLTEAGVVADETIFRGCAHSVLSKDLTFVLPDIIFGGKSYWLQLTYKEGLTVTAAQAGEN